jgi:putative toxin-antitoxin system antitoxin component (TIGR02293 family)
MASLPHFPDLTVEEALGVAEVARILGVHPRTVERHRAARKAPRPLEAQREEKLHRIWRELTGLFTAENAIYWLTHPVPALEDRRPVELMAEDGGLDRVLETIGRMGWGIPT